MLSHSSLSAEPKWYHRCIPTCLRLPIPIPYLKCLSMSFFASSVGTSLADSCLASSRHLKQLKRSDAPAQTCTNRVIFPPGTCLWFLPNISLGIPGMSRTVKNFMALNFKWKRTEKTSSPMSVSVHAQGKHGVNIPYPFNIQENGQNISNFYIDVWG